VATTKKKKKKKTPGLKAAGAAKAETEASVPKPKDIAAAMSSIATKLADEGSARVRGLGKFSIRATQARKGVRRRVVLRAAPEFQAQLDAGAPQDGTAGALVDALNGGESLHVSGLGTFALTDQPATTDTHPRTRNTIVVPARRVLTFSGATLKT